MHLFTQMYYVLQEMGIQYSFYFDRVHLYLDASTTRASLDPILKLSDKNKFLLQELSQNPHLDRKIELFQVTTKQLKELERIIKGDYRIHSVEVTVDFRCVNNSPVRDRLMQFFKKHLVYRNVSKRKLFHYEENNSTSHYFAERKSAGVLVMYDCKAKLHPENDCVHLEYRMKGDALAKNRLTTLTQLTSLNVLTFWDAKLDLRKINLTQLGAHIAHSVQRQTNYRHGVKEAGKITSIQAYLSEHPDSEAVFPKITTRRRLERCLMEILGTNKPDDDAYRRPTSRSKQRLYTESKHSTVDHQKGIRDRASSAYHARGSVSLVV